MISTSGGVEKVGELHQVFGALHFLEGIINPCRQKAIIVATGSNCSRAARGSCRASVTHCIGSGQSIGAALKPDEYFWLLENRRHERVRDEKSDHLRGLLARASPVVTWLPPALKLSYNLRSTTKAALRLITAAGCFSTWRKMVHGRYFELYSSRFRNF